MVENPPKEIIDYLVSEINNILKEDFDNFYYKTLPVCKLDTLEDNNPPAVRIEFSDKEDLDKSMDRSFPIFEGYMYVEGKNPGGKFFRKLIMMIEE